MEGRGIDFGMLTDAELACLYRALSHLLDRATREVISPDTERAYGGRVTAVLACIDAPRLRMLFQLGRCVHREIERRGSERVSRHLPGATVWAFSGLGAFVRAMTMSLSAA